MTQYLYDKGTVSVFSYGSYLSGKMPLSERWQFHRIFPRNTCISEVRKRFTVSTLDIFTVFLYIVTVQSAQVISQ